MRENFAGVVAQRNFCFTTLQSCCVVDRAAAYAQDRIQKNNLFLSKSKLDPIVERASDFEMEPFENGWAKRQGHGSTYLYFL